MEARSGIDLTGAFLLIDRGPVTVPRYLHRFGLGRPTVTMTHHSAHMLLSGVSAGTVALAFGISTRGRNMLQSFSHRVNSYASRVGVAPPDPAKMLDALGLPYPGVIKFRWVYLRGNCAMLLERLRR